MKVFYVFLIALVGYCLGSAAAKERYEDPNLISCEQLQDVASTMDVIYKDAPAFATEVVNQVGKTIIRSGLLEANSRSFSEPMLEQIKRIEDLIDRLMRFRDSNGGNLIMVAENAVFKPPKKPKKIRHRRV